MPNPGVWRGLQRPAQCGALALGCLALAHCGSQDQLTSRIDPKYGVASSPRVVEFGEPVPKGGGTYRIGKPYVVAGITYVPEENPNYRAEGLASFYGQDFHGRRTANGEVFDMEGLSAAHPTLPIPCYARVTNLANHRSVIVRVNDRGPYHGRRLTFLDSINQALPGYASNSLGPLRWKARMIAC
jgi:peptidoglycan lytic transglycosylase